MPTPAWERRPTLYEDLVPIYEGFLQLHATRQVSESNVNPLTASDIFAWLKMQGLEQAEAMSEFFTGISVLDSTWIDWARNKIKEDRAELTSRDRRKRRTQGRS